ncbi:ECF RNA polymerase sigma factor SigD [mine drainage metagenome]|uniref:ECF RNA polymerase sigma factor SigD n=1 Tax=mine drainage metagenome TaxID=410659 RepID=A0A1J5PBV4_9ZZZZ
MTDRDVEIYRDGLDATLKLAIKGDEACFGELWRALNPRLERFLYAQGAMGDPPASDVASETWLQVVRDLPKFKGDYADFRSWLYQVARNRMVDAARAKARRPKASVDIDEMDRWASLEDLAVGVANRAQLDGIIDKIRGLPAAQSEALMLRIVADLSVEETAKAMKKTPNAVRVLVHRALTNLRQEIGVSGE